MNKSSILLSTALIAATVSGYSADEAYQSDDYYDSCCSRFEFWFDPMGVKPCQMVLEFVEEQISQSATVQNNFDKFLDPSFSFGFKIGAQVESNCPTWVFGAQYMWWENNVKGFDSVRGTGQLFGPNGEATLLIPTAADNADFLIFVPTPMDVASVRTKLEYHYNLLDVYGGWNCCLCAGLQLTPYGGFRGFWYSTDLSETSKDSDDLLISQAGDTSTITNDYDAYGIMGGIKLEWNICGQLYFFGSFGGSLISGNNHNVIKIVGTGSVGRTVTFDDTQCLYVHSVEGKFGFNWNFCWCDVDYLIGAYYEVVQWNKVLPHPFSQNSTSPGTATKTLNGLFLHQIAGRIGVSF